MSELILLSSEDFSVQRGTKGNILCTGITNLSLVLFYSTNCVHCQNFLPIFKKLPSTINGCIFGVCNLSANKQVVEMAKNTISKINFVPFILIFHNGKPYMSYNGPPSEAEIKKFIIDVSNNIRQKPQFSKDKVKTEPNLVPAYTVGIPVTGDKNNNVCWLTFESAYVNKK